MIQTMRQRHFSPPHATIPLHQPPHRTLRRVAMLVLAAFMLVCQLPAALAAPKALSAEDMTLTIKKDTINFLTQGMAQAEKLTGDKTTALDTVATLKYELATKYGTFYSSKKDGFVELFKFDGSLATSRGIKVGSTLKKLLETYPTPARKWTEKKVTTYLFQAAIPTGTDFSKVASKRPLCYYGLLFEVDDKTEKVISIRIKNCSEE